MTTVDIFNRALDLVGTTNVVSITDATKEARICLRNHDLSRRSILRLHPWNFAILRVNLSVSDPTPPAFGFANKFKLPDNYLRATNVSEDNLDDWRMEGGFLLSDSSSVELSYVSDVTDPSLWDPLAFDAICHHLAWSICYSLNSSVECKQELTQALDKVLKKAKQIDSVEDPKKDLDIDVWMRARVGPSQGFVRDPMT